MKHKQYHPLDFSPLLCLPILYSASRNNLTVGARIEKVTAEFWEHRERVLREQMDEEGCGAVFVALVAELIWGM